MIDIVIAIPIVFIVCIFTASTYKWYKDENEKKNRRK